MPSLGHKPSVKLTHLDISTELVLMIHLTAVLHMYMSYTLHWGFKLLAPLNCSDFSELCQIC